MFNTKCVIGLSTLPENDRRTGPGTTKGSGLVVIDVTTACVAGGAVEIHIEVYLNA